MVCTALSAYKAFSEALNMHCAKINKDINLMKEAMYPSKKVDPYWFVSDISQVKILSGHLVSQIIYVGAIDIEVYDQGNEGGLTV